MVSYYYPYCSGVTEHVKRVAEGLAARNHDVTILTSKHAKNLQANEILNGVKIKRLPVLLKISKGVFKPTLLPTFWKISKEFDIINIHVPLPEVGLCTLISRNRNIVLTYHCDLQLQHSFLEKFIERVYYISLRIAIPHTKKIVVNDMDYALNSKIKNTADKIVEILPPVLSCQRKNPMQFKKKYGIGDDEQVVGFLGRLVYEKGLEYLIKAVPLILEKIPNARFIIAGEGEEIAGGRKHSVKENLVNMALPFKDRVIFTGFLPENQIEEFYSACDVFVLPSIAPIESFGMVQVEAMLCGTPVIATDMPGVRTPLKRTGMGVIVPPKNEKAIADAVIGILAKRENFTRNRLSIEGHFSSNKTIIDYERVFSNVTSPVLRL